MDAVTDSGPFPLGPVLKAERDEIVNNIRKKRAPEKEYYGKDRTAELPPSTATPPLWQTRDQDQDWVQTIAQAHKDNLVGLALSGGGIRSATFNLGVLQALAKLKLLSRVDYLSTVSGGGYIGGWLAAWTQRQKGGFAKVQEELGTDRVNEKEDREPTAVRFLRVFSNYLTPKLGIFSGDTWTMIAIYLRNLLLNLTIVLSMLAVLLLAPRAVQHVAAAAQGVAWIRHVLLGLEAALLLIALLLILINMARMNSGHESSDVREQDTQGEQPFSQQGWVLALVAGPLFAAAIIGGFLQLAKLQQARYPKPIPAGKAAIAAAITYGVLWLLATFLEWAYRKSLSQWFQRSSLWLADLTGKKKRKLEDTAEPQEATTPEPESPAKDRKAVDARWGNYLISLVAAIAAGALAGSLYAVLSHLVVRWEVSHYVVCWKLKGVLTAGVPAVVGIFLLAGVLQLGLMGTTFRDWQREWWGRLGGWLLLFAITWLAVFWVALYFPNFIQSTPIKAAWKAIAAKYLTAAWILSTIGGVLAGKSSASGKPGNRSWLDAVAKFGPYGFMAGLLCWMSYGISKLQGLHVWSEYETGAGAGPWVVTHSRWAQLDSLLAILSPTVGRLLTNISTHRLWWAIGACIVLAWFMAWRVDVNLFSMHLFYRNRLVRCYLGASNRRRSPNRFTGFDPADDIPLKDLTCKATVPYDGPYLVLNASLNLVQGKDLAWQERKAESFVMTPLYCGYDVWLEEQDSPMIRGQRPLTDEELKKRKREEAESRLKRVLRRLERYGFRPTAEYAFPPPSGNGPNLGLAMGTSGAAASPNMGSYSSTPVAFLMTVFNVRLGQWMGNPRHKRTWKRATPMWGLTYLLKELFAGTTDEAAYVYLSDGGHFDNTGLYELVKRRCGLIILCDAEEDCNYQYRGLANAIRKCRIDMGIDIDLDLKDITPEKEGGPLKQHCAIGKIRYNQADVIRDKQGRYYDAPDGTIIYFKASLTGDEPVDVAEYRKAHPEFPHESTAHQWFSESQFESYRRLGCHVVDSSIRDAAPAASKPRPGWRAAAGVILSEALQALEGGEAPSRPKSLNNKLQGIFEDFGFDMSELAPPRPAK